MQSMEKEFHPKFLEYASEKTRWVFWWVFSSGYEVKKPGGFFRVGWVFSNVASRAKAQFSIKSVLGLVSKQTSEMAQERESRTTIASV